MYFIFTNIFLYLNKLEYSSVPFNILLDIHIIHHFTTKVWFWYLLLQMELFFS
jgi:hypothetical protein